MKCKSKGCKCKVRGSRKIGGRVYAQVFCVKCRKGDS